MLGAAFFAWGGYMALFMYIGVGYMLISPVIFVRLFRSRDSFNAEMARQQQANAEEEIVPLLNEDSRTQEPPMPAQPQVEIKARDFMKYRDFNMAMLCLVSYTAAFLY